MTQPQPQQVQVDIQEILDRADKLDAALPSGRPSGGPQASCGLKSAQWANLQLTLMVKSVQVALDAGELERKKLVKALRDAAQAYEHTDNVATQAITGGPDPADVGIIITYSDPPFVPLPYADVDSANTAWENASTSDSLAWEHTVDTVHSGDQGASLSSMSDQWQDYQVVLGEISERLGPFLNWTGDAATAAQTAFQAHREWLEQMSQLCAQLASQARALLNAQSSLTKHHPTKSNVQHYEHAYRKIGHCNDDGWQFQYLGSFKQGPHPHRSETGKHYMARWYKEYQQKSNHALTAYAQSAKNVSNVQPSQPPSFGGSIPTTPTPPLGPNYPTPQVIPPIGDLDPGQDSGLPQTPQLPTMPELPQLPSSPTGAGAPNSLSAASMPKLPSTKAASVSGGGAGGGMGGLPLEPAPLQAPLGEASGTTLGAASKLAGALDAAASEAAGAGGMGMAPVGPAGGQGQNQNAAKGKRRVPGDEALYTEDRAHTESVIGQRRRREALDAKESAAAPAPAPA